MKKKTEKKSEGSGQDAKRLTSRKNLPGALNLLSIANHLSRQIKKVENPALWPEKCRQEARGILDKAEKGGYKEGLLLMKAAQVLRGTDWASDNKVLATLFVGFNYMSKDERKTIPGDPVIKDRIDKVCKSIDAKTTAGFTALGEVTLRGEIASTLRYLGELDFANLALDDSTTFNQHVKDGLRELVKNDPGVRLDDDFFKAIALKGPVRL